MKRLDWKQAAPSMQLLCMAMRIEGHLSNWQEGIISNKRLEIELENHVKDLRDLEPHIQDSQWKDYA